MEPPYEARRRRSSWSDVVRRDTEIQALDEANGEWILCATCAAHYQRTGRGRRPNDPLGFKVKMNGRFQEAAWIVHKSRVVAHRLGDAIGRKRAREETCQHDSDRSDDANNGTSDGDDPSPVPALLDAFSSPSVLRSEPTHPQQGLAFQIPRNGWMCPGIVPSAFYHFNAELVHAFSKYYVGSYRINVVRDIRTDRVLLFSHECENKIVQRGRQVQSLACNKCHAVWTHHKSFRRILKKMERYIHVEDLLRHAWSLSPADLETLSRFKHASCSNLNLEGRKLKQAVIDVLQHYGSTQLQQGPPLVRSPVVSNDGFMRSSAQARDEFTGVGVNSLTASPIVEHSNRAIMIEQSHAGTSSF